MSSEDAASVLDHFINDVANLPAELAHLLEEIQAKDQIMQECLKDVNKKNTAIENFIKANTSAVVNPQEEKLTKVIREKYERADQLQKEKDKLAKKAEDLVRRITTGI
jgi:inhibitor of growth protein 3